MIQRKGFITSILFACLNYTFAMESFQIYTKIESIINSYVLSLNYCQYEVNFILSIPTFLPWINLKVVRLFQYFGHLIWRSDLFDSGKDWGQEEKGMTEDEMVGWHHRLNGHGFGWTPGVGNRQGGLACCGSWGCKESNTIERLNWTDSYFVLSKKNHHMSLNDKGF